MIYSEKKKIDFLIVGSLCNTDLLIASALSKMGMTVKIIRHEEDFLKMDNAILDHLKLDKNLISIFINKKIFMKEVLSSKVIISISGSLIFFMGKYIGLTKIGLLPPIISYVTGSDILEEPFRKDIIGYLYRFLFKNSFLLCVLPMKDYIKNIKKLKLSNIAFVRHPYLLLDKFQEEKTSDKKEIIFAHFSNIDWGETDSKKNRISTKGTDNFIRAFVKASEKYKNIKCLIMDRGPDKERAKEIILKSGCKSFDWISSVDQINLYKIFNQADVVVDQFYLGAFGAIAIEAMSAGKPLLTFVDKIYLKGLFYNDIPNVYNARTENEIYNKISHIVSNYSELNERGASLKSWIRRNYNNDVNFVDIFMKLDAKFGYDFMEILRKRIG